MLLRSWIKSLVVTASFCAVSCSDDVGVNIGPQDLLNLPRIIEAAAKANAKLSCSMIAWSGTTPEFDGHIEIDEYSDASHFTWTDDWIEAMPLEIESKKDLYFEGWVKHDGEYLYLAFDIEDDIFYGIETERWLPEGYSHADIIGERERGRPWFGDMIEILLYGRLMDLQVPVSDVTGDGRGIQIIYNLTKSLEGGVGVPGMLPHGPGLTIENFENNKRWILDDIINTRTHRIDNENRYTVEVRIRLDGGIEIEKGNFWSTDKPDSVIGFNLSIGDVDTVDNSPDGRLHHETWWAGKWASGDENTRRKFWGLLVLTSQSKAK